MLLFFVPTESTCEGDIPGIQVKNACCPLSCGECGGAGCTRRDGGKDYSGREACCGFGVLSMGRVCSDTVGAPCTIGEAGGVRTRGVRARLPLLMSLICVFVLQSRIDSHAAFKGPPVCTLNGIRQTERETHTESEYRHVRSCPFGGSFLPRS